MKEFEKQLSLFLELKNYKLLFIKNLYEFNTHFYEITIDGDDLNTEVLQNLSYEILDKFDQYIPNDYSISLTTKGIETKIDDTDDLKLYKGYEVEFVSPQYKGKAILKSFDEEYFYFQIKDKTRLKEIKIKPNNLSKIKLAYNKGEYNEKK